jgi:hypothetical protein
LTEWATTDRPRLYRDMVERAEFKLTPLDFATLPIPQMILVFRPKEQFASSHTNVLKQINERRAKQGLSPIKDTRKKG